MGVSEGESESEALQNIREAIELYLEPVDDLAGVGKEIREIVL
jgi:predicted RNase H-like HicB family nuclease